MWQRSEVVTDEVAGELGCNVADLLADVGRGLLLDAQQQLCLDGHLHGLCQAGVDLLKGRRQQPSQEHGRHLFDLSTATLSAPAYDVNRSTMESPHGDAQHSGICFNC